MNTSTLNDWLKRGLAAEGWSKRDIETATHSPCLTLADFNEQITEEDAEAVQLIAHDGVIRTPFPLFRYWMEAKKNVLFGCAKRAAGELFIISFHKAPHGIEPACFAASYLGGNPFGGQATYRDCRAYSTRDFRDITERYLADGKVVGATFKIASTLSPHLSSLPKAERLELLRALMAEVGVKEEQLGALKTEMGLVEGLLLPNARGLEGLLPKDVSPEYCWLALHACVMRACYEYLAPYNFMAVVRPDREHKSIEWIKAREHYVVIHRRHPANNPTCTVGAMVSAASVATSRLSHSRRAHTRLLSSAKFRYKRGQRVFVRAAWVGPKEWRDTAGQIYQILTERADDLEVAAA